MSKTKCISLDYIFHFQQLLVSKETLFFFEELKDEEFKFDLYFQVQNGWYSNPKLLFFVFSFNSTHCHSRQTNLTAALS